MRNGFVFYRYRPKDRNLLFEYMNSFVRVACGFQWGTFFIGVLRTHPNPPNVVRIISEPATPTTDREG